MSDFKLSKSGQLKVSGDVSIMNCNAVKEALLNALKSPKQVMIDIAEASGFDLSFLQVYFAFKRSAEALNKGASLVNPPDAFLKLVEDAGFGHYFDFAKAGAKDG
ncbi:MAG: STAS domain-containing protein [Candidatus Magnetominusculus sp. LBB02]|nr:STAS domain-containing protein [Candidatus Magnetominusculus sp. LBB02]